jgi:hypothetical protein
LAVIFQEMLTGTTPWPGRRSGLPNFEPLSAGDCAVLARALDIDPGQRFATCTELLSALAGGHSLRSDPALESGVRAGAIAIVAELIVEAKGALLAAEADRWVCAPSAGCLQSRFPARLAPGDPQAFIETFRRQWNAQIVRETDNAVVCRVPLSGRFWQRWLGGAPRLLVGIRWTRPKPGSPTLPEVSVRATFLSADDKPGETIEGRGKDLSLGGMGLYLPRAPAGSPVNLELLTPSRVEPIILSGYCVRVQRCSDGWFETGVLF